MVETLDVRGLPDEHVQWLKRMVDGLKAQARHRNQPHGDIIFATHKSRLIGGYDRTAAYEDL